MTTFDQLDKALHDKGWTYDRGDEMFRDGSGKIIRSNQKLLTLVPGMTLDELVSYQDDKSDHYRPRK